MKQESTERKGFIDNLLNMDSYGAMKLIVKGMILAVIFGTALMTSRQINLNAATWQNIENQKNEMAFWNGEITQIEFTEREEQITLMRFQMQYQFVIFGNIFRGLVNLSLLFVVVGFIGLAKSHEDDKIRALSIMISGVILFVLMLTTFFSNIAINLT
jgi:ABC-type multidrug transport system fused ATPase/permease subunit